MRYEETVKMKGEEIDRINRLLSIQSLEEMTDEDLLAAGANTNHCEGIYFVEFENGSSINYDLCSGSENYFDDVVWTNDTDTLAVSLECEFEIGDIEFEYDGDTYCVKIERI